MSLVTRRGDDGETDLWFADRVSKYHPQVEAYGAMYESQGALGLARSNAPEWLKPEILKIQKDIFLVSAELATLRGKKSLLKEKAEQKLVDWIDSQIERYEKIIKLDDWYFSGESASGSALDLALSIVRRGERWVVKIRDEGYIENPHLLTYLNRLSDLLFLMARACDQETEIPS
ncbi:MAG: cob(I)yrinic acid a,c-diamide adenosyltransferase [Nitrospinota bacterium]|nr:cob(I)yrinic acid a,c-diamide adenosyltransferase [Nitrospinota bacterium]